MAASKRTTAKVAAIERQIVDQALKLLDADRAYDRWSIDVEQDVVEHSFSTDNALLEERHNAIQAIIELANALKEARK